MDTKDKKTDEICSDIKDRLTEVNAKIRNHENKISSIKEKSNQIVREKDRIRAEMKNLMTKYGISLDFVADAFIPKPFVAVMKGATDFLGAPNPAKIEEMMKNIQKREEQMKHLESEIMGQGVLIRSLVLQRDDLVREWRYSKCGRNGL